MNIQTSIHKMIHINIHMNIFEYSNEHSDQDLDILISKYHNQNQILYEYLYQN